ncbi:uncharacterized protein LOC113459910 [Zonotrichia albicollis]|uniref:uncharacterized protein LOC113459910 n=1 Tax=Zonotrichia albicollis TaxID=44394 RepID=UPI003D8115A8
MFLELENKNFYTAFACTVIPERWAVTEAGRLTTPEPAPTRSPRRRAAALRGRCSGAAVPPPPGQGCTEPALDGGGPGTEDAEPTAPAPALPTDTPSAARGAVSRRGYQSGSPRPAGSPRRPLALPVQEARGRAAPGREGTGCPIAGARPRPQRTARPGTGEKVARGGAAARAVTPQGRPVPWLRAAARPRAAPSRPAPVPPAAARGPAPAAADAAGLALPQRQQRWQQEQQEQQERRGRHHLPPTGGQRLPPRRPALCRAPVPPRSRPRSPPQCLGGAVPAAGSAPAPGAFANPLRHRLPRPLTDGGTARPLLRGTCRARAPPGVPQRPRRGQGPLGRRRRASGAAPRDACKTRTPPQPGDASPGREAAARGARASG